MNQQDMVQRNARSQDSELKFMFIVLVNSKASNVYVEVGLISKHVPEVCEVYRIFAPKPSSSLTKVVNAFPYRSPRTNPVKIPGPISAPVGRKVPLTHTFMAAPM